MTATARSSGEAATAIHTWNLDCENCTIAQQGLAPASNLWSARFVVTTRHRLIIPPGVIANFRALIIISYTITRSGRIMDIPLTERPLVPSVLTASNPTEATNHPQINSFSWLEPHPEVAVIFVGPEEVPFGVEFPLRKVSLLPREICRRRRPFVPRATASLSR